VVEPGSYAYGHCGQSLKKAGSARRGRIGRIDRAHPGDPKEVEPHPILDEVATMKDLVKFIAQALVDQPDQVQVKEIEGEQTSVIELKVAKEDLGKVIGKQGRTARAMRTILSAASTKIRKRAVLEILE
jgi:hypothetical protein